MKLNLKIKQKSIFFFHFLHIKIQDKSYTIGVDAASSLLDHRNTVYTVPPCINQAIYLAKYFCNKYFYLKKQMKLSYFLFQLEIVTIMKSYQQN